MTPLDDENVKLTMYQGVVKLFTSSLEDVIGNAYTFVNEKNALSEAPTTALIDDLRVADVRFYRTGRLGDVVARWDTSTLPEKLPLKDMRRDVGSIQFSCVTSPGGLKVSLLYFLKGHNLKISGGFPPFDVVKYLGLSEGTSPEDANEEEQVRIIDAGVEVFFRDVINLAASLCGSPVTQRKQFVVSGQYDIRGKIEYDDAQLYHFLKDTRLFGRVVPPNGELRGRRSAFKLYVGDPGRNKEYSCAIDRKGKVQMFSCASYAQVHHLKTLVNEIIHMGVACRVVELMK